jgi:hypothetical protein
MKKIALLLVILLSACTGKNGSFDLTKPISLDMRAPDGPPQYQMGWSDGCESGLSSNNDKIQLFLGTHKYTYNSKLRKEMLYVKAWKYAYEHCAYSMKAMERYKYL